MNDMINIFFATNQNYIPFCGIAIHSLLSNASKDYFYDIRIMHSGLGQEMLSGLAELAAANSRISFVDVSDVAAGRGYYDGVVSYTSHVTKETFYRLLIPEMFPKLPRVLYLDCDLVVLGDIAELYSADLQGKAIGAVYSVEQWCGGNTGYLPNQESHEWFNAGVMLFDIARYIEKDYPEKCEMALEERVYEVGDQELLREICYKDVEYLPFEWNVMWHHLHNGGYGIKSHNEELYKKAVESPKIVHYSGNVKPWKIPGTELGDFFFRYARETNFFDDIMKSSYGGVRIAEKKEVMVSVIMPVYNGERFLQETMDSLMKQTFQNFELICIDDGSVDATRMLLTQYADKDERVRIIHQENSGGGISRNNGMDIARGKYLYFMDADDILEKDALEKLYYLGETYDTDIIFFGAYRFDSETKVETIFDNLINREMLPKKIIFSSEDISENVFQLSYAYVWTRFYKRDFIINNNLRFQEIRNSWDTSFVYLTMCIADKITFLDDNLIHYRMGNLFGASMNSDKFPLDVCKVWRYLRGELIKRNLYEKMKRSFANRAAEHILNKFWLFHSYESFSALYSELKKALFEELDLFHNDKDYFFDENIYEQIRTIQEKDFTEFVFEKFSFYRREYKKLTKPAIIQKPYENIPEGSRIILYGAGRRGQKVCGSIICDKYCKIVAWVDRKPSGSKLVASIDEIAGLKGKYDYVVIGVADKDLQKEIRKDLIEIGIEENQII